MAIVYDKGAVAFSVGTGLLYIRKQETLGTALLQITNTLQAAGTSGASPTASLPIANTLTAAGTSSPNIVTVGSLSDTTSSASGATFPLTTTNIGDVMILFANAGSSSGAVDTISSISGSGTSGWNKAEATTFNTTKNSCEIWYAVVTSVVSAVTQTVTFSDSNHQYTEFCVQEYNANLGSGTTWSLITENLNSGTGTALTAGSVTSTASNQLVIAAFTCAGTGSAGSTPNFTYDTTAFGAVFCYLLATANNTAYAPTCTQSPSDPWGSVSAILQAA